MTPLNYACPSTPAVCLGLAVAAGLVAVAGGVVTVARAVHAVRYDAARAVASQSSCATCADEQMAGRGPTIEQTVPLGLLSGGVAVVAAVQSARFANAGRR